MRREALPTRVGFGVNFQDVTGYFHLESFGIIVEVAVVLARLASKPRDMISLENVSSTHLQPLKARDEYMRVPRKDPSVTGVDLKYDQHSHRGSDVLS